MYCQVCKYVYTTAQIYFELQICVKLHAKKDLHPGCASTTPNQ